MEKCATETPGPTGPRALKCFPALGADAVSLAGPPVTLELGGRPATQWCGNSIHKHLLSSSRTPTSSQQFSHTDLLI